MRARLNCGWVILPDSDNPRNAYTDQRTVAGRVEDWRGIPKAKPSRFSPFPLGVPHYLDREPVSSPRHIAPSVQISRTGRTCLLRTKGYGAYCAGAAFALIQRRSL